jgi:uncharacterized circularly permuted ATP-grasp superfamily protein
VIPAEEWRTLQAGLKQRRAALNMFLNDVYHDAEIVRAGKIPSHKVFENEQYRPEMRARSPERRVRAHRRHRIWFGPPAVSTTCSRTICGTPSGVSLHAREPQDDHAIDARSCFARQSIAPVEHIPICCSTCCAAWPRQSVLDPTVVVLSPGQYNSAYFEHVFLAQQMGVEVVEGADLFVKDDWCSCARPPGRSVSHVIYRRIDDDFLDRRRSTRVDPGRAGSRGRCIARAA